MTRIQAIAVRGGLFTVGFAFLADNLWQAMAAAIFVGSAQLIVENSKVDV